MLIFLVIQKYSEASRGVTVSIFLEYAKISNRVVAGCEKMVQKVASSSTFLQQNLYMLRVLPAQDELVLQQVT